MAGRRKISGLRKSQREALQFVANIAAVIVEGEIFDAPNSSGLAGKVLTPGKSV
jgi:hypothetical protein